MNLFHLRRGYSHGMLVKVTALMAEIFIMDLNWHGQDLSSVVLPLDSSLCRYPEVSQDHEVFG